MHQSFLFVDQIFFLVDHKNIICVMQNNFVMQFNRCKICVVQLNRRKICVMQNCEKFVSHNTIFKELVT